VIFLSRPEKGSGGNDPLTDSQTIRSDVLEGKRMKRLRASVGGINITETGGKEVERTNRKVNSALDAFTPVHLSARALLSLVQK
jgi:hypothetical protein